MKYNKLPLTILQQIEKLKSRGLMELMKSCPSIHAKEMGFPENWESESLWQQI